MAFGRKSGLIEAEDQLFARMHLQSIGGRTLGWPDESALHLVANFGAVALVDILAGPHDFAGLVPIFGLHIANN